MTHDELLNNIQNGIFEFPDLSDELYHSKTLGLSRSSLLNVEKSIDHMFVEKESTKEMIFGNALHCRLLKPKTFNDKYALCNLAAKKGKQWIKWQEDNYGKIPLKVDDYDAIASINNRYINHPFVKDYINHKSKFEHSYYFAKYNVLLKFQPDIQCPDSKMMIDLKTSTDIYNFSKSVFNYLYDYQAGFYLEGAEILEMMFDDFWFLAIEKKEPYKIKPWRLPHEGIELGKEIFNILLLKYIDQMNPVNLSKEYKSDELPDEIEYPNWALDISKRLRG